MSESTSALLAWWQLLRAGNVFTAASNVIAGFLLAGGSWQPAAPLLVLIAASALLYEAGMVLNDVFDADVDAPERPERPIPSGRISGQTAAWVGWSLLLLGVSLTGFASYLLESFGPLAVGLALAVCIVGYDGGLKDTFLGPWAMGACRLLNVLLGTCAAGEFWQTAPNVYAGIVGLYTVGLTYLARFENYKSMTSPGEIGKVVIVDSLIRRVVGCMILGFILIDAIAVYLFVGWAPALVVLSLLLPTWIASRFAPMT